MTPVAVGNTNPVTLISYSFVGLGLNEKFGKGSIHEGNTIGLMITLI